jgi:translation initiation factor IF-3
MEVIGKIKLINETQTFGASDFRKRELVITTNEQYPQMLSIEFVQDKVDVLDNYKAGQDVKVHINLRGREWINPEGESKYFNTIQGWRIETLTDAGSPIVENGKTEEDDLPF